MKLKYLVVYERERHSYHGRVLDIPGVGWSAGSLHELRIGLRSALEKYILAEYEAGSYAPLPTTSDFDPNPKEAVEWLVLEAPEIPVKEEEVDIG